MKKITIWLSLLLTFVFINAKAQVEDFESTTAGSLPTGWTAYQAANDDPGFSVMDASGFAHQGTHYLAHMGENIAAESTSWVVTAPYTVGNDYEFKMFWRGRWSNDYNFSGIYISTGSADPVANPGDFSLVEEFSPANYPNTWLQWNEYAMDLSSYSGQTIYLAIEYTGDHAHDFFVDEMGIAPIPYCDIPSNLEVTNRGMDTIDLSWTGIIGVDNYELTYGAPGFDPNGAGVTIVPVNGATTYQLTGLTQSTHYEIYVRSACSSYNHSSWEGPVTGITSGPPPANDDCDNAISLTVNPDLNCGTVTHGTTLDASASPQPDDVTGHPNNDVWFSFVATNTVHHISLLNVTAVLGTSTDMGMGLYDGTNGCANLTFVDDSDPDEFTATGLTVGTTYYLRVYGWFDALDESDEFDVCVGTPPPPPANDTCSGAIGLTVYPAGGSVGNELAGDTTTAYDSNNHPTCDGTGTNLDLWYTFTVPAGATGVKLITGGANGSNIEAALYDTCGGTEYDCQNNSSVKIFNGLTGGVTYALQIWHDDFNAGAFTIAMEELPHPPSNSDCANASSLTVYPVGGSVGNESHTDLTAGSDSGVHPSCDNYGVNLDVWYTFTVPAGETGVKVLTSGLQGGYVEAALYDSCGGTELDCKPQGNSKTFTGLTAGTTYYLQTWLDDTYVGDFDIAIESIPPPPTNNDCASAMSLTVYSYGTGAGNELAQSTDQALDSGVHPSCDTTGTNLDLWYTVTIPAGETGITVKTGGNKGGSIEAALYDSCGGTDLDCQGNSSMKMFTGLTSGTTYYLQVWLDDFNSGDFDILIETLAPPPANDLCANAINITPSVSCVPTIAYNNGATDSGVATPSCANYNGGDLWFTTTVPANGSITIETTAVNGSSFTDSGMAVYDGACGTLNEIQCDDDGGSGLMSLVSLTGRTPGETIYIRVWEYGNNSYGEIGVCAYDASVSLSENTIENLSYYPNPVNGILNISAENDIEQIRIYDITGQEVIQMQPNKNEVEVQMQNLPNGLYFVKLQSNSKVTAFKIVKK